MEIAQCLLENGAIVDAYKEVHLFLYWSKKEYLFNPSLIFHPQDGATSLICAAFGNNIPMIKLLLDHGAKIDFASDEVFFKKKSQKKVIFILNTLCINF